ncbi:hypothetical protein ACX3SV_01190 [Hafnia paralvei]
MSNEKKSLLNTNNGVTTGGLGAVLTTLVPAFIPDQSSTWRPVCYALAPIISAMVTYGMAWVISRHGLESPAEAALRNKLERSIKNIDKQLNNDNNSPEFKKELLRDREETVRALVNIGKTYAVEETAKTSTADK